MNSHTKKFLGSGSDGFRGSMKTGYFVVLHDKAEVFNE